MNARFHDFSIQMSFGNSNMYLKILGKEFMASETEPHTV